MFDMIMRGIEKYSLILFLICMSIFAQLWIVKERISFYNSNMACSTDSDISERSVSYLLIMRTYHKCL